MKDLLLTVMQAVIIAAIPTLTAYVCTWAKQKTEELAAKTNSARAQQYIREVSQAITTAVAYTAQTYVDELKGENMFDADQQKEALISARNKALQLISADAQDFIAKAYGDINNYITTGIEAEIRNQKLTPGTLTAEAIAIE
ncbi:MAG: hypothetical protein ACI4HO_08645 [Ruminococcus sp.]